MISLNQLLSIRASLSSITYMVIILTYFMYSQLRVYDHLHQDPLNRSHFWSSVVFSQAASEWYSIMNVVACICRLRSCWMFRTPRLSSHNMPFSFTLDTYSSQIFDLCPPLTILNLSTHNPTSFSLTPAFVANSSVSRVTPTLVGSLTCILPRPYSPQTHQLTTPRRSHLLRHSSPIFHLVNDALLHHGRVICIVFYSILINAKFYLLPFSSITLIFAIMPPLVLHI